MELPSHTVLSRPGHLLIQWGNLQIGENFRRKIFWLNNCLLEYATHPKWLVKFTLNYHAQQFFYICLLSGRSQYSNMNSDNYFYFVSFFCYCYQWPLLLFCTGMNQVCTQGPSIFQTSSQAWLNLLAELVHPVLTMECLIAAHRRYGDLKHLYRWIMPILVCQMSIFYFKLDLPDAFFQ